MWRIIIWYIPAVLLTYLGMLAGVWGAGLGLALAWLGFCVFMGSIIVHQQEFAVIERLGEFQAVYFRGWHVYVLGVDRIRATGELRGKQIRLYADEKGSKMDFLDASAPIDSSIWYQIGDPKDIAEGRWNKVADAVKAWIYAYDDPEKRIYNLVDGELRPLFQRKTIDQANQDRNGIADDVMDAIVPEMAKFGVYTPSDKKRLIIKDIDLPDDIVKIRQRPFEGRKNAEKTEHEAAGYWKAIKAIQDELKVTVEEARSIYETQIGLKTLGETKPSMTLVGKDFKNVLGTINLGNKSDKE